MVQFHPPLPANQREDYEDRQDSRLDGLRALREHDGLGAVAAFLALIAVTVVGAGWTAVDGDLAAATVLVAIALGFGLGLDTILCKHTPTAVHECRHCRRETDRWRGPTRSDSRLEALTGQPSAADETPTTRLELETENRRRMRGVTDR